MVTPPPKYLTKEQMNEDYAKLPISYDDKFDDYDFHENGGLLWMDKDKLNK